MDTNDTPPQKIYILDGSEVGGFNSNPSLVHHYNIITPTEIEENKNYNLLPFNRSLVPTLSDIKKQKRLRGSRVPKVPMRLKYLKYLDIPKEFILPFRFAANVDYLDLYKSFSPRHIASFFSLFAALRVFENYITHKQIKTPRGKYVTISRDFLRKIITNLDADCAAAIKLAIYLGYIERNDSYQVGEYSKSYRLGPKFQNAKWVGIDFLDCLEQNLPSEDWRSDSRLPQRTLWNKFNLHRAKMLDIEDPILKNIAEKQYILFKDLTVEIDDTFYAAVVAAATQTFNETVRKDSLLKVSKLPKDYNIESVIKCYLNSVETINAGEVCIKFHDKSYDNWTERMFHSITNMPGILRRYLRYKGQKLVNVDIRAAQVCLLAIFYNFHDKLDLDEKQKFISFVTEKDFYTEISKDTTLARPEAKDATFKLMFAQNYCQKGIIYEEFKRLFPRLIEIVYNTKKNEGYKRVSQIMQRTESKIMIRGALNNIINLKIPTFSIHDSLLCLKEDIDKVRDAISNAFFEEMKFYPVLKID